MTSTQINKALAPDHKKFTNLVKERIEMAEQAIVPYTVQMNGIPRTIVKEFGSVLTKLLGKINKRIIKDTYERKAVGTHFMERRRYSSSRNRILLDEELFFKLDKEYLTLVSSGRQRNLVSDFIKFRNATLVTLHKFDFKRHFEIKTNLEITEMDIITTSNGILVNNRFPKQFFIEVPNKRKSILIEKVSLIFSSPSVAGDDIFDTPQVQILLVGKDQLLGSITLQFFPYTDDADIKFNPLRSYLLRIINDVIERPEGWGTDQTEIQTTFPNRGVESIPIHYIEEQTIVKGTSADFVGTMSFLGHSSPCGISSCVALNWHEILLDPIIKEEINNYINSWQLIAKAWKYLQTKYSHRLMTAGDF